MQISVDNNARPHNQQIINSPSTSYSTRQFHMWKKVLMRAAKHQTTSMLWSQWLITVSKSPTFLNSDQQQSFSETYGNMAWASKVVGPGGKMVVKLTALARLRHYCSSLQIWTKNRCCLSIPDNGHQPSLPWKCWCTGKEFSAAVKAYYFGEAALLS